MIRVEIENGALHPSNHDVILGAKIVNALRIAGVPVKGVLTVQGIERGQLQYETGDNMHVFRWIEDQDDREGTFTKVPTPRQEGPQHARSATGPHGITIYKSGRHTPKVSAYVDDEDDDL